MLKSRYFPFLLLIVASSLIAFAEVPIDVSAETEQLFSPSVSEKFYDIAHAKANKINISDSQARQSILLLLASKQLDPRSKPILSDMVKLASMRLDEDYSEIILPLLIDYVDSGADLEVISGAINYLQDHLNTREQREQLYGELLRKLQGNRTLDSELATAMGLLMAEKADSKAASYYFMGAYQNNKFNKVAFSKLAELIPNQIDPAIYLEQLRITIVENPLDLENALSFAQYAEQLQLYDVAADAYRYSADLFEYLYPSEELPAIIYLPWALSNYNSERNQPKCLQIAEKIRRNGQFDLLLEAIAGKAAMKLGDNQQVNLTLNTAENKAKELYKFDDSSKQIRAEQLAWFYSFLSEDTDEAINWANKAASISDDSEMASAIMAYAFAVNGQKDLANPLIEKYPENQIAILARAKIQLLHGQKSSALKTLKTAINKEPGSLAAEKAKQILAENDGTYIPPVDPKIILAMLKNSFGEVIVPEFLIPEQLIAVQLRARGSKFSYGAKFGANISIKNMSTQPLVISGDSMFKGRIRIDAKISGDLNIEIPNLISTRIRPTQPIAAGQSIVVPADLVTGDLKDILLGHPQASLDIQFTTYIDPVVTDNGEVINSMVDLKPAVKTVKRPGIKLTGKYLQNRLNSIAKGQQGQKIKTAQLFIGLLLEQHAMANINDPLYKFIYADWMPDLLKSALMQNITSDDWVAQTNTMAAMIALPLDYSMINAVAKNLNDPKWPVRLTAVYLLQQNPSKTFDKVLAWSAEHDSEKLVREMASAMVVAPVPDPEQAATLTEQVGLLD